MFTKAIVTFACLVALGVPAVSAQTHHFSVSMDGSQAMPATTSPGTGTANILYDENTGEITFNGSFSGFVGLATGVHLHVPSRSGPAIVLVPNAGVRAGSFSFSTTVTEQMYKDDIVNGLSYMNIHSTTFRPGEIRGAVKDPTVLFDLGDVNQDNFVNFLDISPFIAALASGEYQFEADADGNFDVNFADIPPFIALLTSQ